MSVNSVIGVYMIITFQKLSGERVYPLSYLPESSFMRATSSKLVYIGNTMRLWSLIASESAKQKNRSYHHQQVD